MWVCVRVCACEIFNRSSRLRYLVDFGHACALACVCVCVCKRSRNIPQFILISSAREFLLDHYEWSRSFVALSVLEIVPILWFFSSFLLMDEFLPHSTRLLRRPLAQFVVGFASLGLFIYDNVKSRYLPLKVGRLGPSNNRASVGGGRARVKFEESLQNLL